MSWVAVGVIGGLALGGGGLGYNIYNSESNKGKNDEEQQPFFQLPDYSEATGARGEWWKKLQEWGAQPGYGAIAPNWTDIWESAKNKIGRSYWGGPAEGGGLAGKVRASAARRGVSEQPSTDRNIANLGMQENIQLGDLATNMATQEAAFGEQGRQNWMTQLMNLSQQKPSFMGNPAYSMQYANQINQQNAMNEIPGEIMSAVMQLYGQKSNQDFYSKLLQNQYPTTTASSLYDNSGYYDPSALRSINMGSYGRA